MEQKKTKIEVRLTESEKASLQAEAERLGLSVSELVRQRMSPTAVTTTWPEHSAADVLAELAAVEEENAKQATLDLDSAELQSLRSWLSLEDSDGVVDAELLAEWKAYGAEHATPFDELLEAMVVDVNARHLDPALA